MNGINRARTVQVIEIDKTVGMGTHEDPVRGVKEYWSTKGFKIGEVDTSKLSEFALLLQQSEP